MIEVKGRNIISLSSTPTPEPTGTKVLIYGDSITAGAYASDNSHAYYSVYQNLTGLQVRTVAQFGRSVQENIQSYNVTNSLYNIIYNPTSDQLTYSPIIPYDSDYKYIMFRLGVNDCLQQPNSKTDTGTFRKIYRQCIKYFMSLGWPTNRIKIINIGSYLGTDSSVLQATVDYNLVMQQLCSQYGFQLIDLHSVDLANTPSSLYVDQVHPGDSGHLLHGTTLSLLLP